VHEQHRNGDIGQLESPGADVPVCGRHSPFVGARGVHEA
jgi:hypothetical protein